MKTVLRLGAAAFGVAIGVAGLVTTLNQNTGLADGPRVDSVQGEFDRLSADAEQNMAFWASSTGVELSEDDWVGGIQAAEALLSGEVSAVYVPDGDEVVVVNPGDIPEFRAWVDRVREARRIYGVAFSIESSDKRNEMIQSAPSTSVKDIPELDFVAQAIQHTAFKQGGSLYINTRPGSTFQHEKPPEGQPGSLY